MGIPMPKKMQIFSVHVAFIVFAVVMIAVIDILYHNAIWINRDARIQFLGYSVEIGHIAITLVYWSIVVPLICLYAFHRPRDRRGLLILVGIALTLQVGLVEDVLFFLFQRQDVRGVTFTWLYVWNDLFQGPILGTTVLFIALFSIGLAYVLYWKHRQALK